MVCLGPRDPGEIVGPRRRPAWSAGPSTSPLDRGGSAVICVSVTLNGVPQTIAGAPSAQSIEASVGVYPELKEAWLRVVGETDQGDQPSAYAHWAGAQLKVGDVVEFRLIDSSQPSAPRLGREDPSVEASESIPFICGFCGKPAREVEGMTAGTRAMICHGCVRTLHEMLSDGPAAV